MAYGIWCTVSGGVTGRREAWLKHKGIRATYETRDDAEREAMRLRAAMNDPYATATFRYDVVADDD